MEDASLHLNFVAIIVKHLHIQCTSYESYFPCSELQTCYKCILNLLKENLEDVDNDKDIKEDLFDLSKYLET